MTSVALLGGCAEARGCTQLSGVADELVSEEDEAATNALSVHEAHGLLVAGLAEEALASPEHDGEDDQPQLVDQVVLQERATQLIAGRDDDLPVELALQLGDLGDPIAVEDRRVVPAR